MDISYESNKLSHKYLVKSQSVMIRSEINYFLAGSPNSSSTSLKDVDPKTYVLLPW